MEHQTSIEFFKKFEKAMDVLQGDIDALEQEKVQLTKKLDLQSKKAIHAGIMGSRYSSEWLLWLVIFMTIKFPILLATGFQIINQSDLNF